MRIYRPYARVLRAIYRAVHPLWKTEYQEKPEAPVVYVIHHQDMFGPVHTIGLMPEEARIWAFHVFCDRKSCFSQFYHYTFVTRYGWTKPFSFCLAKLLSWLVPPILHAIGSIPVYYGAQNLITMRKTLQALLEGDSIAICPDADYTNATSMMEELQEGFLLIEKLYSRKTQRHLPFVPIFCSKKTRSIVIGEAVCFPGEAEFSEEQDAIAQEIRRRMNAMGVTYGDIEAPVDGLEKADL